MSKVDELLMSLGDLSINQAAELKDKMKDRFHLTYPENLPVLPTIIQAIVDDKVRIGSVSLTEIIEGQKVNTLKIIRECFGLSLQECKAAVDTLPSTLKAGTSLGNFEELEHKFAGLAKIKFVEE